MRCHSRKYLSANAVYNRPFALAAAIDDPCRSSGSPPRLGPLPRVSVRRPEYLIGVDGVDRGGGPSAGLGRRWIAAFTRQRPASHHDFLHCARRSAESHLFQRNARPRHQFGSSVGPPKMPWSPGNYLNEAVPEVPAISLKYFRLSDPLNRTRGLLSSRLLLRAGIVSLGELRM